MRKPWPRIRTDFHGFLSFIVKQQSTELRARTEVEQETNLDRCRFQVMQQLRFVGRLENPGALEFQQYSFLHQNVPSKSADFMPSEPHRNCHLSFNAQACFAQRDHKRFLVHRFQESITKLVINFVENPNDFLRQFPML